MLLYKDKKQTEFGSAWDYVFEVDDVDYFKQKIKYFSGAVKECSLTQYTFKQILNNLLDGTWKIVDNDFYVDMCAKSKTIPPATSFRIKKTCEAIPSIYILVKVDAYDYLVVDLDTQQAISNMFLDGTNSGVSTGDFGVYINKHIDKLEWWVQLNE